MRKLLAKTILVIALSMGLFSWTGSVARAAEAAPAQAEPESEDVRLGRENAAELDKQLKFITDPAVVDRVARIGQEIAAVANTEVVPITYGLPERKRFQYSFKVVDDKDVNAFSLPGGFIYVNKGLLDFVQSDDELAGVLAHEIAHAAHRHMMKLMAEASKEQARTLLPILIVGALAHGSDIYGLLVAGQLYLVAKVNTWSVEAEKDADQAGARYLIHTRFKPVGILTFMERLARKEMFGTQELGIMRTHPPTPERAQALLAELESLKVPINRRETDPSLRAVAGVSGGAGGTSIADVRLGNTLICKVTDASGVTAKARAEKTAATVNQLLDAGLQTYEVRISADGTKVTARGITLVQFTAQDMTAQSKSAAELSAAAKQAIQSLIWGEQFNRTAIAGAG